VGKYLGEHRFVRLKRKWGEILRGVLNIRVIRMVDKTSSGSCPITGFTISGVESSGSVIIVICFVCLTHIQEDEQRICSELSRI
jgi:hypothetical protein